MEAQVKKEDRRVRRTKKLLTQALTELMQQKQVKEITVTELTDLADMNRGTFYLYYKDIFDMLEHIEDNMFQALNEILERHEKENVVQETEPILRDILGFIEENQEMVRVLLSPHGDMNFLHRLNDVLREKCLQ
ncbi:MAG: TetR/AcrR family transcriptional regulator, partial [Candidatus Limiplasma sp.]|nr:TetR/AcrR family transcriptional regulator [Candidatus Limiplasma sp.]